MTAVPPIRHSSLTRLSHEPIRDTTDSADESVAFVGIAKIVSGHILSYAEVRPNFYDDIGTRVERALDRVDDREVGETWQFTMQFPGCAADAPEMTSSDIGARTNV